MLLEQAVGIRFQKKILVCENRILAISHCNCPERAQFVKETILDFWKVLG